jgi:hypothetical protein
MAEKAVITADFPTQKDVASRLGVSPARAAELHDLVVQFTGRSVVVAKKRSGKTTVALRNASRAKKK